MRSSTDKTDPGYDPEASTKGLVITLDGRVVRDCITADEERGEVWCYVRNPAGGFELSADHTEIRRVCHRGKVVISPPATSLPQIGSLLPMTQRGSAEMAPAPGLAGASPERGSERERVNPSGCPSGREGEQTRPPAERNAP